MTKTTPAATGARTGDAKTGDSPDNASPTTENSSAATPPQAGDPIVPEPLNIDLTGHRQDTVSGTPGLGNGEDVMVTVETVGEFMLQDPYTLDVVPHEGSAEVRRTSFIEEKLLAKQLKEV